MIYENKTWYELYFRYRNLFTDAFLMLFSVVLMAVFANIRIPLWPVPVTLQTFGVFLAVFFFGSARSSLTMVLYILFGLLGFGVFAGYKSGIAALLGPTGGYLIGMVLMAFVVGLLIERGFGRTWKSVVCCMVIGEIVLFASGLTGLYLFLGNASILKVLSLGLFPFILGESLKILVSAYM